MALASVATCPARAAATLAGPARAGPGAGRGRGPLCGGEGREGWSGGAGEVLCEVGGAAGGRRREVGGSVVSGAVRRLRVARARVT